MVTLMLRFSVVRERHGALLSFLARAVPIYERPGGIRVRLLQGFASPDEFVEIVEYRDEGTYQRDQVRVETDATMRALLEEWRQLHAGTLSVETYREVAVPGDRNQ